MLGFPVSYSPWRVLPNSSSNWSRLRSVISFSPLPGLGCSQCLIDSDDERSRWIRFIEESSYSFLKQTIEDMEKGLRSMAIEVRAVA